MSLVRQYKIVFIKQPYLINIVFFFCIINKLKKHSNIKCRILHRFWSYLQSNMQVNLPHYYLLCEVNQGPVKPNSLGLLFFCRIYLHEKERKYIIPLRDRLALFQKEDRFSKSTAHLQIKCLT